MFFENRYSDFSGRNARRFSLQIMLFFSFVAAGLVPAFAQPEWVPVGPAPITGGQVENVTPNDEVNGAINSVQAHPSNADIIYVGGVNSGVWKTENATSPNPTWMHLTDTFPSLSAAEVDLDLTDVNFMTLVVGIGRTSSLSRIGGERTGLLRTTDGGDNWTELKALAGSNISGVISRGNIIVAASNAADDGFPTGLFRSTDSGENFTTISNGDGSATGLPGGFVYDLFGDPSNPARLYLINGGAAASGGVNGVYRSDDTGATWTKVSNAAMDAALVPNLSSSELAVGASGGIGVGMCQGGRLVSLFHSGDAGANWAAIDVPNIHPGTQAGIHFSIGVDPTNSNLVYVGGDRQPAIGGPLGNSDWSGNLWRVDASAPSGSQSFHLTHRNDRGAAGGGTANSSAPHADSRNMAFDANGDLLETNDGGIYRRTSPQDNTGDWFSIMGNIQGTEHHNIAYDSNANIIFGGAQDNGTESQVATGSKTFEYVNSGDGGDVAVDDFSTPGQSVRWVSAQSLLGPGRITYDANNNRLGRENPSLNVISGPNMNAAFVNPIEMNSVNPDRMLFLASNGLYESADMGDTLTQLSGQIVNSTTGTDPVAFGATDNPDVIYVGTAQQVWIRTTGFPNAPTQSTAYPGGGSVVRDISIHPNQSNTAWVASSFNVYMTTDTGASWTDITGNLDSPNGKYNRSLVYIHDDTNAGIVVGSRRGAFIARQADGYSVWNKLEGLPEVAVFDLDYDAADDVLVAGTMGRGDWMMNNPLEPLCSVPPVPSSVAAASGNAITVTWSGSAPGYDVFRAVGTCEGATFTQVATNINMMTYVDNDVTAGTMYAYQIRGTADESGNCVSEFTSCVQAISCGNNEALYPEWGTALSILDFITCIVDIP